jgi:hypothetical protein
MRRFCNFRISSQLGVISDFDKPNLGSVALLLEDQVLYKMSRVNYSKVVPPSQNSKFLRKSHYQHPETAAGIALCHRLGALCGVSLYYGNTSHTC